MKRLLFAFLAVVLMLTSCQKEGVWKFDYPKEVLCGGVWVGTAINPGNKWTDITRPEFRQFEFTISFGEDGSYSGTGYFGYGVGTYEAAGKTIKTFIDGNLYCTYEVVSMSGTSAEVKMIGRYDEPIGLRVQKY